MKRNVTKTDDIPSTARRLNTALSMESDEKVQKAVKMKMQAGNISGAVWMTSSEKAVAPCTTETRDILLRKHPRALVDANFPARLCPANRTVEPTRPEGL
ncbi:hypothetical protein BV898_11913 [Hypsibius exemplaris]|uniref:Uncharacterized protein n=1 Tax=Hypsibius exemplaris TaxID=2072580 RepID=A0A1W0WFF2_HYPEX|nr:hypothetical protein BV898_11913 [Hypsibius exemplaris]